MMSDLHSGLVKRQTEKDFCEVMRQDDVRPYFAPGPPCLYSQDPQPLICCLPLFQGYEHAGPRAAPKASTPYDFTDQESTNWNANNSNTGLNVKQRLKRK